MIPEDNKQSSTIFSDPAYYQGRDKKPPKKGKKLYKVLCVVLAACILAGGTWAAIKFIPDIIEDDKDKTINVISVSDMDISSIHIDNEPGEITFKAELVEGEKESSVVWSIDGVKAEYIDSSSVAATADGLLNLKATEKLENVDIDCGFEKPAAVASVYGKDNDFTNYTVTVGKEAIGGHGHYCKISTNPEVVYIVDISFMLSLQCKPTDFSIKTGFSGIAQTEANSSCFTEGEIVDFDYFTLTGKQFPKEIKMIIQDDESINAYFAFLMEKPIKRIANIDTPQEVVDIFSTGVQAEGAYCFDPDAKDLKKYNLDNPDVVATMSLKGNVYTVKFSFVDETYAAMYSKELDIVFMVSRSSVPVLSRKLEDYYSTFLILENLSGLSKFKIEAEGKNYDFDISYQETESDRIYTITSGDKKIKVDIFKALYQSLIGMTPISHETKSISSVAMKITFIHKENSNNTVLTFKEYTSGRYQAEIDGTPVGIITKADYDKLLKDTKATITAFE